MDLRKPPRRFSGAVQALLRCAAWSGSHLWPGRAAYRRYLARGGLEGVEQELPLPDGAHPDLAGLRIVQVSDLHAGPFLDEASLAPVVDLVRAYEPHVLALTGDFITHAAEDVYRLGTALERMRAGCPAFAVFGNHDYRGRREGEIAAALRRQGVQVLRNASAALRHGAATLRVVGLEDIEESHAADLEAARRSCRADDSATILLCHHPDVVDALPPGAFDVVLCGHTHGGQVVLPGLGAPAGPWLPRRRAGAFALPDGGRLYVNRGVGVLVLPLRVGARAEVTCLRFGGGAAGGLSRLPPR